MTTGTVREFWLAALTDDASDALALAALDAVEGREACREALRAALDALAGARADYERLTARYLRALDDNRALRSTRRPPA